MRMQGRHVCNRLTRIQAERENVLLVEADLYGMQVRKVWTKIVVDPIFWTRKQAFVRRGWH
jgi:hypothetical protein